jgi:hypothetical protein
MLSIPKILKPIYITKIPAMIRNCPPSLINFSTYFSNGRRKTKDVAPIPTTAVKARTNAKFKNFSAKLGVLKIIITLGRITPNMVPMSALRGGSI